MMNGKLIFGNTEPFYLDKRYFQELSIGNSSLRVQFFGDFYEYIFLKFETSRHPILILPDHHESIGKMTIERVHD